MTTLTPSLNPEAEVTARIQTLNESIKALEGEIRIFEGKLANRDEEKIQKIEKENVELQARVVKLTRALYVLLIEAFKFQHPDDAELKFEILRKQTVDYCKKANITPELWKSIDY